MNGFLYENHQGSPTLTLLNVLGVLGVLYVLHVLHVVHLVHVLNMPMEASSACWALFIFSIDYVGTRKSRVEAVHPPHATPFRIKPANIDVDEVKLFTHFQHRVPETTGETAPNAQPREPCVETDWRENGG